MTSFSLRTARRFWSLYVPACLGLLTAGLAPAQTPPPPQTFQIGRVDFPSPLSDIVEQVVTEAFKRAGLQAEFKKMPLLRSITMADEGALDGDLLRIADAVKRFPNLVAVPTPVSMLNLAIYGRDAATANKPRADIAKLKVGLTRGTLALVKHSTGMAVTDTQTISTTFEMLQNNRFDVALMVHIDAELELTKTTPPGIVRRTHYWASEPVYLLLNKKYTTVIPKINAALIDMEKEGFIFKAYQKGIKSINIQALKAAE